jgi:EpsI family protein
MNLLNRMKLLNNKYARILTILLLLEGTVFYAVAFRAENVPLVGALSAFPKQFGGWRMVQDVKIEPEIQEILQADDLLNRSYLNPAGNTGVYLFIAYFKTQRAGQAPHSPKNCLPGSGWEPIESGPIAIDVPGRSEPIRSNRYVVAHGEEKSVVLYWYQSHNRIIASEFAAKFWLVADSIKYHRSDSSLVKVVVPVSNGDTDAATRIAVDFVQTIFPDLTRQLPG